VAIPTVSLLLGQRRTVALGVAAICAVLFAAIVAPEQSKKASKAGGYNSALIRSLSYGDAITYIGDHPWLGTGARTYIDNLGKYGVIPDPNNLFLLTWAELGIPGVIALGFLLFRFASLLVRAKRLPDEASVIAVGAGGAALTLLVHFQVDISWVRGETTLEFAMIGIMLAVIRLAGEPVPQPVVSRARTLPANLPRLRSTPLATESALSRRADRPDRIGASVRVLHVVGSDAFAGTERHVLGLVTELQRSGCEIELACPRSARVLRRKAGAAGIPLRTLVTSFRSDAEIIHVHDGRSAVLGWFLASRRDAALVRTQHFVTPASSHRAGLLGLASRFAHRLLNRRLDGYVCVSEAAERAARSRHDAPRAKLAVIPPGIQLATEPQLASARTARARAGYPLVVSAGRVEQERRFDVLLEAIPAVLRRYPECQFRIAGTGQAEPELHARARELGVAAAVDWTGWLAEIGPVLAEGQVYVNTWPAEGFGMATAEAMGYGLPVIVTDTGASPELVEDQVSGRIVRALDPAALAGAITDLLDDPGRATAIGSAARERSAERYSFRSTAASMLAFYEQIPRIQQAR
jgi:glycosyltransferase involved in cell wall biosynthesis